MRKKHLVIGLIVLSFFNLAANKGGYGALDIAEEYECKEIIEYLKSMGAKKHGPQ